MQSRFSRAHCRARFGPNFGFDATATNGSCDVAAFKEQHLRASLLRRRAARPCDRGNHYSLATSVRVAKSAIKILLCDCAHRFGRTGILACPFVLLLESWQASWTDRNVGPTLVWAGAQVAAPASLLPRCLDWPVAALSSGAGNRLPRQQ